MNRFLPVVVIVVALVVAFLLSRPKSVADGLPAFMTVTARVLEGQVIAPQKVDHLRVVLQIAGVSVADAEVKNGQYQLRLPNQIAVPAESLENVSLVHGDGRLPETALGGETKLLMYDDQNKNALLDSGEPQLEATLFKPKTDQNLRAFFRYKILLLKSPVGFVKTLDSATGAKGYYRYQLPLRAGWNILEGELASNGYDVRLREDNQWDILVPLPASGKATPPAFTPQ
jgi:hypothetical protein